MYVRSTNENDAIHGAVPILRKNGKSFRFRQHSKGLSFIIINDTEYKHAL
jgi:hypothetical protein